MNGSAAQKLLQQMRQTASGWGQKDFEHLFKGFGFTWKEGKKHRIYYHPRYKNLWISVPRHNTLKEWVARDAIKLIDELLILSGGTINGQENKNA
ncbi:MAG TPA: type II toxin-antitoxin system HicA family toxin [Bacteroidota bacterium]|nr:type II toxin-antitoxin system HicA family toxin [Bacteroidota bacterium]